MNIEEQISSYLADNKLRKAHKKILVARYLKNQSQEVTAETIWMQIKEKRLNISIASVYNSLNWLVELGFAKRAVQGRKFLYQIRETSAACLVTN